MSNTTESNSRPFPSDLLDQSPDEKLDYFRNKLIFHPKLRTTYTQLIRAITYPQASLVMVIGPTGVGKTTLRIRVEDEIRRVVAPTTRPSDIPIAGMAASASMRGSFDWKAFFTSGLEALVEPFINRKTLPFRYDSDPGNGTVNNYLPGFEPITPTLTGIRPTLAQLKTKSDLELRLTFEQALKQRHTKAFIIDEAQHLKPTASGRKVLD
jgi:hypothetical protein